MIIKLMIIMSYTILFSVNKIAREELGDVLLAVDKDEGVPEFTFESNSGSIDTYILCVYVVIFVLGLLVGRVLAIG